MGEAFEGVRCQDVAQGPGSGWPRGAATRLTNWAGRLALTLVESSAAFL